MRRIIYNRDKWGREDADADVGTGTRMENREKKNERIKRKLRRRRGNEESGDARHTRDYRNASGSAGWMTERELIEYSTRLYCKRDQICSKVGLFNEMHPRVERRMGDINR